jgi:hypothetical protein
VRTESARFSNSGYFGIGTTTPTEKLTVAGNAQFTGVSSGAYAYDLNLTTDGTLTTSASDARLKTNLVPINASNTLDKIMLLTPYTFNWKTDPSGKSDLGLIAQDVEPIFPELVFTNKTDGFMGINYSRLSTILISGIQEMEKKVSSLWNGVADLVVNSLKAKKVNTEELCVGSTCVTEEQFIKMMQNAGTTATSPEISPAPVVPSPTPETPTTPTPAVEPEPTTDPVIVPDLVPVSEPSASESPQSIIVTP